VFKEILVNLSTEDKNDFATKYAISVASDLEAHLTGVAFAYETIVPGALFDSVSAAIVAAHRAESRNAANSATERFEKLGRDAGIANESRVIGTSFEGASDSFGHLARRYDLSIVSQTDPEHSSRDPIIEAALFGSGRPVLIVPYIQKQGLKLDRVLLCWDGSRHAARAFGDAMPLLTRSKHIDVITIAATNDNKGEISGADIAHYLARHQLTVDLNNIVAPDSDVPSTILSHAADISADLIVMGGYGHSRLRELILGGTTRGVLASMTVPTMMSH
jgi:nucleotide-binding universal stress UspA family protein